MWKSLKDRAEGVKEMKRMKTTEAVGQVLCHDITQIIPKGLCLYLGKR